MKTAIGYGKRQIGVYRTGAGPLEGVRPIPESSFAGRSNRLFACEVDVEVFGEAVLPAYTEGDNSQVVPTDTMKNTVYAMAREHLTGSIEDFGRVLAQHFLEFPQVERATVSIQENRWRPVVGGSQPAPDAFIRAGEYTRTANVIAASDGTIFEAGIQDLTLMKTTKSAFERFPRDAYTTLPEVSDRIMATRVKAVWTFNGPDIDWDASFDRTIDIFLSVFAEHFSPSVQNSIWVMGRAILELQPDISEVRMTLPNLHHWLVDLSPFGQDNPGEIFVATTEPHGLIEATVRRSTG